MCTGLELMIVATVLSAGGQLMAGEDQAREAEIQGAYALDEATQTAKNIRKAGKRQQGAANVALAASGVKLGEGTALEIQNTIDQDVQQDALAAILGGQRAKRSAQRAADNARTNSYFGAASSVLSSGAQVAKGGWKSGPTQQQMIDEQDSGL
jgi:hypothetical protein